MMIEIVFSTALYIGLALLGLMLLITVINLLTAPQLLRAPEPQNTPLVSLLIPARNEAANIENCLRDLRAQDYPKLEILVLNDNSHDDTATLVQRGAAHDERIRLLEGVALPQGWLGKNWACHQLSMQARGEFLIFTDADLRYAPQTVRNTVGWMQRLDLGMLSAFSQQITITLPEKLVVPLLDMFVYSYLPLWLTYYTRKPSLAAANGHWLAFTRAAYSRLGGHAEVRSEVVEDVELSRRAKRLGEKILTVCGKGRIFTRMYDGARGIWEGYSKNLFGLTGFRAPLFFVLLLALALAHILPYALVWFEPYSHPAAAAILMNLVLRLLLAVGYGHAVLVSALLHPLAVFSIILIGLNSFRWYLTGKVTWKGRAFYVRPPSHGEMIEAR